MCQLTSLLRCVWPKIDEAEAAHLPEHEIWVSGFVFDAQGNIVAARSLVGRHSLDSAYGAPPPWLRELYTVSSRRGGVPSNHMLYVWDGVDARLDDTKRISELSACNACLDLAYRSVAC